MTGKHYKWHTHWQRLSTGELKHSSGLVVRLGAQGWVANADAW